MTATTMQPGARGLATVADDGTVLDTLVPRPRARRRRRRRTLDDAAPPAPRHDDVRGVRTSSAVSLEIDTDDAAGRRPPTRTCACTCCRTAWCSRATINLDGIFGLLANVAWTNLGPVPIDHVDERAPARARPTATCSPVHGLDKFPRMTDYVVPQRRAHRRRRPRAPRRPPRAGHHRDARGVLQLQRRHARHVDGRGPDQRRRHRRRRQRHRRRRVDHGHAVGRRHRAGHASASAACSAPKPASASASATSASSRPACTSPPARW